MHENSGVLRWVNAYQVFIVAPLYRSSRMNQLRMGAVQHRNIGVMKTMATAKKASAKKPADKAAPKTAPAKAVKAAAPKSAKAPVKKAAPKKVAAPKVAKEVKAPKAASANLKPIKDKFNKTTLVAHLVQNTGLEAKAVKAVLGSLEATILASINKKGAGEFTWPGMIKVSAQQIPAKKARKGIDPFTKVERMFAAKPASVKVKARFFKKVKDAAL